MRSLVKRRTEVLRRAGGVIMEPMEHRLFMSVTPAVAVPANPIVSVPKLPSQPTPLQGVVGTPLSLSPQLFNSFYEFNSIFFKNGANVVTGDGSGETIAVVTPDAAPTLLSDIQVFDAHWGITNTDSTGAFSVSVVDLNTTPVSITQSAATIADTQEQTAMQVEWAHAVAPKAHILVVQGASNKFLDLMDADVYAAAQTGVTVVLQGFTANDTQFAGLVNTPDTNPNLYDGFMVTPNGHLDSHGLASNVAFIAQSGDLATSPGRNFPAASLNVIPVGGYTENTDINGNLVTYRGWDGAQNGQTPYAKPWNEPQVALDADPGSGVWIYDSTPNSAGSSGWIVTNGTALAAAGWAGLTAIVDQGLAIQNISSLSVNGLENNILFDSQASLSQALSTFRRFDNNHHDPKDYPLWPHGPGDPDTPQITLTSSNGYGWGAPIAPAFVASIVDWSGNITNSRFNPAGASDIVSTGAGLDYFAFATPPTDVVAGAATSLTIDVNHIGNFGGTSLDTAFNGTVTIALQSGPAGGTLAGTLTATAVNGVATFSGLTISKAGIYSFIVSNPTVISATSPTFNVSPAALHDIDIPIQPVNASDVGTQSNSVVALVDQFGNLRTTDNSAVTISIASGPAGGTIIGSTTVQANGGYATFTGLSYSKPGVYTVTYSDGGVTATSSPFTITTLHEIDIPVQTGNAWQYGSEPQSVVALVDAFGALRTADHSTVTVTIASGPAGATVSGDTAESANGGYAFFSNLSLSLPGIYTLQYSDNGVTATSNPFAVVAIPITSTRTLNGARLSPAALVLQRQRNAAILTKSGPPPANLVAQQFALGNAVVTANYVVAASSFSSALITPTGKTYGTSAADQLLN